MQMWKSSALALFLILCVSACDSSEPEGLPTTDSVKLIEPFPDMTLRAGAEEIQIFLRDHFSGPVAGTQYIVSVAEPSLAQVSVVRASVSGGALAIYAKEPGETTITVEASAGGNTVEDTFLLHVLAVPVELTAPLPDTTLYVGDEDVHLRLHDYFRGPPSNLSFSVRETDPAVAQAVVDEGQLRIAPRQAGETTVTVEAESGGDRASDSFRVRVLGECPSGPSAGMLDRFPIEEGAVSTLPQTSPELAASITWTTFTAGSGPSPRDP